jgi:hypothetical protein
MTAKRTITVTIDPCGRPTIDAKGFTGQGCKKATKPIEDALGASSGSSTVTNKPEINLPEQQNNGMTQGY